MPQTNTATAYQPFRQNLTDHPGWPKDQVRYYKYSKTKTCEQGVADFRALSKADQVTYSQTAVPEPPVSEPNWIPRTCGSNTTDPTDLSGESNIQILGL